ncbi:MAG: ATP-binding cassette domain-containing protein [Flavobacteriaceae bacterium]|jgi:lipopolysaccharide transport system ATP-binding protein|nr:ATP-binding cassette domain-containing protein [Flavobacteriaceae bacterium]
MPDEILVKVEGLSKKFSKNLKRGFLYGMQDLFTGIAGGTKKRELRKSEFWALDDISFELKRGDCLGIIGHNGAGKSTLLKILNGTINPDRGRVEMHGRVNALIELGSGINPVLTGRENIFNNAAVLGFTRQEIKQKLDEIIDFSELEDFIDTPVQYYSSGMKAKLNFSTAAFLEPDVLILDEVLSVGDVGFRTKSFNKMQEMMRTCAVLFVSHSMTQVARVCSKALFMQHGKNLYYGEDIPQAIELYFNEFKGEKARIEYNDGAEISNITINSEIADEKNIVEVVYDEPLALEFNIEIRDKKVEKYFFQIQIIDKDLKMVAMHHPQLYGRTFDRTEGKSKIKIIFPNVQLGNGEYSITYFVHAHGENSGHQNLAVYRNYTKFKMVNGHFVLAPFHLKAEVFQD